MSEKNLKEQMPAELGLRKKIGTVTSESGSTRHKPEGLTEAQNALREATINHFKSNKVKAYITQSIKHINSKRQVADSIRLLFDEHGNPPKNATLEDIIAERKKIEVEIRWFEAVCSELKNKLVMIKEIEELSMDFMDQKDNIE
jgi:protoheme ferro-lyase